MISFNLIKYLVFEFSRQNTTMLNFLSESFVIYYGHIQFKILLLLLFYKSLMFAVVSCKYTSFKSNK